jgi:hypothetical protein
MLFIFFLPITDYKTVRMKLSVLGALALVLTASVTRTHVPGPASRAEPSGFRKAPRRAAEPANFTWLEAPQSPGRIPADLSTLAFA